MLHHAGIIYYLTGLSGIFGSLSSIKMIETPDNGYFNCSIFCSIDIALPVSSIFERATWLPQNVICLTVSNSYLFAGWRGPKSIAKMVGGATAGLAPSESVTVIMHNVYASGKR